MIQGCSFLTGRSLISWNSIKIHDIGRRIPLVINEISCRCLIPDDTIAILSSKPYLFHVFPPSNPFLQFFSYHALFFFASFAILSFLRLLSYPIHQVCVSLDKLYCSWPGWLVASSLSTKNEKGSKAKFVAPIVFRPPEMCSLWMIDPRKEKERNSPPIFDHRDFTFFVFWFLYVLLAVNVLNAY